MIQRRLASKRGKTKTSWLDSWHTFSFAHYHDPAWMGFRSLRVINDDRVAAGAGFPTHPHRDMEILTVILDGELEHEDSMGTGSVIRVGDVQKMGAGKGVLHSEFNPSTENPTRLLQIWITPDTQGVKPNYDQRAFPAKARQGTLCLFASGERKDGVIHVQQDVDLYGCSLTVGDSVSLTLRPGRGAWVQIARGNLTINGQDFVEGDGAAIEGESQLTFATPDTAEFLLFDLA